MQTTRFFALTGLLASILFGCTSTKPASELPVNEPISVEKRAVKTAKVSSWEISGALAAKNSKKAWTASYNWRQQGPNNYQIRLFGPVGGGTVIIDKEGGVVRFKDGPKTITSHNADTLLHQQTGVRLPVQNLYYWVRGLPAPGAVQSAKYDEYNHLVYLQQGGYTIEFTSYTSAHEIDLPSKIQLTGQGVSIKLIIKRWVV